MQACAIAIWAGCTAYLIRRYRISWWLVAPLTIAIAESIVPAMFEWHVGVLFWRLWPLTQVAEIGGPGAISAVLVLWNLFAVEALSSLRARRWISRLAAATGAVLLTLAAAGFARGVQVARWERESPTLRVGLLQPNFGVASIDDRARRGHHYLEALGRSTDQFAARGVSLIVWPETAWPMLFDQARDREFAAPHPWAVRRNGAALLMGAATHEVGTNLVQNSALLIRSNGTIAGRYDKRALVPFSEFVPLSERYPEWAERVRKQLPGEPRFAPGEEPVILEDGALRAGPLICSEDLRPELAAQLAAAGANLLVAIGSDAWLGDGPGPRQHLALATIRAVETRRQLLRVTTTGISAHIDARGRVLARGPLVDPPRGQIGDPVLMVVEPALVDRATLGPLVIGWFDYGCAAVLGFVAVYESIKRERRKAKRKCKRSQR